MDFALDKMITITKKSLENSRNSQKMDKYIRKDDHIPKLKFWGVTELTPLKQNLVPRFAKSRGKEKE